MKLLAHLLVFAPFQFPLLALANNITSRNGKIDHGLFPADLNGSNFTYPWPLRLYRFQSQGLDLEMAFMDITINDLSSPNERTDRSKAKGANSRPTKNGPQRTKTAVLLHGRNFCAATWEETARVLLTGGGYNRVIIPDQIGFCKSSKPGSRYQFSLQQLALNTHNLLAALGTSLTGLTVIGHSMGGMLGIRYSLLYPSRNSNLILVNPIGLEDYLALGVPYQSIDDTFVTEQSTTYSSIRSYEQSTYYPNGPWTSSYDKWATMLANIYSGSQSRSFTQGQARVVDMVLTQPVVYELPLLKTKTLLLIGQKDTTAIGKQWSPPEVQQVLGRYDLLGKKARDMIPGSTLVEFPDLGHAPHIQDPERFHAALVRWLKSN
ncbi:hydrolase [Rhypophila decipiens]|uniref:Hydrolase n=1 Tax=Rhypophila decipiens TaxID=261697 RepID=A0AAN6Y9M5_9PEZI|nr:hydrolase [Rhypophila decipiens]